MRAPRLLSLCLTAPSVAWGFTFETSASHGCHEQITLAALRDASWPGGQAPPDLTGVDDLRVARDLPFRAPADVRDPWTLAFLLGVRDNDLHGASPDDFTALARIHASPDGQAEHCLRRPQDDGPEGDRSALDACRAFILDEVRLAVGTGASIDLRAADPQVVSLAFSGSRATRIQRYGWHMGKALHALQDSFTHTLRSPDGARVRHVLNFADWAEDDAYVARRDGHEHLSSLDRCELDTPGARGRTERATRASAELLRAVVDGSGGAEGRAARARAVLDAWIVHEPGCTVENRYCDAPEFAEEEAARGCATSPGRAGRAGWWAAAAAALGLARRRRSALAATALLGALVLSPGAAQAQAEPVVPGPWGLHGSLSASLDRGAFAARVGGYRAVTERLTLGLSAEWNPWYSISALKVNLGVVNLFATATYVWKRMDRLRVHSAFHVGASVLLVDLVGGERGDVGVYVGTDLLGVTIDFGPRLRLRVDPANLAVPVPHLRGVPIVYTQYRFTVGVEYDL